MGCIRLPSVLYQKNNWNRGNCDTSDVITLSHVANWAKMTFLEACVVKEAALTLQKMTRFIRMWSICSERIWNIKSSLALRKVCMVFIPGTSNFSNTSEQDGFSGEERLDLMGLMNCAAGYLLKFFIVNNPRLVKWSLVLSGNNYSLIRNIMSTSQTRTNFITVLFSSFLWQRTNWCIWEWSLSSLFCSFSLIHLYWITFA